MNFADFLTTYVSLLNGLMIIALNAYQYTSLRKRNGGTFSTSVAFTKRLCSLDLLVGVVFTMFSMTYMLHKEFFSNNNNITKIVYPLLREFILSIILHASVLLQCWLTVLKMMLTRKPLYKLKVTPSIVNIIFVTTVVCVSVVLTPLYFVKEYDMPRRAGKCDYLSITHPLITYVCLCGMGYCYRCIYYTLVERQKAMKRKRKTACTELQSMKRKTACTGRNSMVRLVGDLQRDTSQKQDEKLGRFRLIALLTMLSFIVCWTPYSTYAFVDFCGAVPRVSELHQGVRSFLLLLRSWTSIINPITYFVFVKKQKRDTLLGSI